MREWISGLLAKDAVMAVTGEKMCNAKGKKALCRYMAEACMHELDMYMWTVAVGAAVEALLCLSGGDRDSNRSRATYSRCHCVYCHGNCLGIRCVIIFEALDIDECCNAIDALTACRRWIQGWWKKV